MPPGASFFRIEFHIDGCFLSLVICDFGFYGFAGGIVGFLAAPPTRISSLFLAPAVYFRRRKRNKPKKKPLNRRVILQQLLSGFKDTDVFRSKLRVPDFGRDIDAVDVSEILKDFKVDVPQTQQTEVKEESPVQKVAHEEPPKETEAVKYQKPEPIDGSRVNWDDLKAKWGRVPIPVPWYHGRCSHMRGPCCRWHQSAPPLYRGCRSLNWDDLKAKWGLDRSLLSDSDVSNMLNNKKSKLVTLNPTMFGESFELKARLSFRANPDGSVSLRPHFITTEPNLSEEFKGVKFSKYDREMLEKTGLGLFLRWIFRMVFLLSGFFFGLFLFLRLK